MLAFVRVKMVRAFELRIRKSLASKPRHGVKAAWNTTVACHVFSVAVSFYAAIRTKRRVSCTELQYLSQVFSTDILSELVSFKIILRSVYCQKYTCYIR